MKLESSRLWLVLVMVTTSCTTWHTIQKDQLPLIAGIFETHESVELEVQDEDSKETQILVDTDTPLNIESNGDVLHTGMVAELSIESNNGRNYVRLLPRSVSKERRMSGVSKLRPLEIPVADLDVIQVGELDSKSTAMAVVGVVVGLLVFGGIAVYAGMQESPLFTRE